MTNSIKLLVCMEKHCNKIATIKKLELEKKKYINKTRRKCYKNKNKNKNTIKNFKCVYNSFENSNYKKLKDSVSQCLQKNCKSHLKKITNNIYKSKSKTAKSKSKTAKSKSKTAKSKSKTAKSKK